jgi:hypothetical protein
VFIYCESLLVNSLSKSIGPKIQMSFFFFFLIQRFLSIYRKIPQKSNVQSYKDSLINQVRGTKVRVSSIGQSQTQTIKDHNY